MTVGWLSLGIVYSVAYAAVGYLLGHDPAALSWFRAGALLLPPLVGGVMIFRRRSVWTGCQWLFWATIALGLAMSAVGLSGWATGQLFMAQESWLAWPAVFALFGNVAPLFALLAQPHRGPRERLAATTAIDIAGLAVVTGFLYTFFVTDFSAVTTAGSASSSLLLVSELQAGAVAAALIAASLAAQDAAWVATYRRLALGAAVAFVMLTLSNLQTGYFGYTTALVYDLTWILPFAFFPWAVTGAPVSPSGLAAAEDAAEDLSRPRPWVIFAAVALLPFVDFGLRGLAPPDVPQAFRDLSSAVAIISVLPLLLARIASERAELQHAGSTTRLLAQVIEQAQDLILVLTPEGRVRHANDAFSRATGFPTAELLDRRADDLCPADPQWAAEVMALARGGGVWRGVVTRSRHDGSTFPVAVTMTALTDGSGQVAHVVSVERDISEERRLREQLIQSERLSAVGQLISGVAHELNNPLQSVIGVAELMAASQADAAARRDLHQILASGRRAARVIQSLYAFSSRSNAGRGMANLNDIVRTTVELRAVELKAAAIVVQERYAESALLVMVNREEIQQAAINLLTNAEDALRDSGPAGCIAVRTGFADDAVYLEVADNGPGVPPASAGRIFEPFFTTKDVGNGAGLGLSIALGIAQAHGGSLELVAADRGACFRLTLPSLPVSVRAQLSQVDASQPAGVA